MAKYLAILLLMLGCGWQTPMFPDDAELEAAAQAWGVIEMCPVKLRTVTQSELDRLAGEKPKPNPDARLQGYADDEGCVILVRERLDWDRRAKVIMHEMGHLFGVRGHLHCADQPGDDIMCPDGGGPWVTEPTDRDNAFVRGADYSAIE